MAHGKNSKLYVETTPGAATKPPAAAATGYTLLTKFSNIAVAIMKDIADSSVIGVNDKESEAGQQGGSISGNFRLKQSEYLLLYANYQSDTPSSFAYRPEGDTVGKLQMVANYHIGDLSLSSSNGDVINGTFSAQRTGPVNVAVIA